VLRCAAQSTTIPDPAGADSAASRGARVPSPRAVQAPDSASYIATAGGAVAGAAVGANVGRSGGGQQVRTQEVERCADVPNDGPPDYWDVTYSFRGQEHRVQMRARPGATIMVNQRGEPREARP
jgi:hypothetical protein